MPVKIKAEGGGMLKHAIQSRGKGVIKKNARFSIYFYWHIVIKKKFIRQLADMGGRSVHCFRNPSEALN
jgi:hypothetical protein